MRIKRENLVMVLYEYIQGRQQIERADWKYTGDSALLAGMRELLNEVRNDKVDSIEIED